MSNLLRMAMCLLLCLVPSVVFAQGDGQELEGKPVHSIRFEGLRTLTPDAVMAVMTVKVGAPFAREALDRDVRRLSGWQDPAPVDPNRPKPVEPAARLPKLFAVIPSVLATLDASGGVVITLQGEENRRVMGLVFLGALEFGRDEFLPIIRTRAGNLVDDFTLELDRQELERWYRERGFHYVSVRFVKETERSGDIVLFNIIEGVKVKVREVIFEGLVAFNKDQLLEQMLWCAEPGFWSSKEFVLEQVRRDVVGISAWMRGQGHLDARATLMEWVPTPDHERVDLMILVEEGRLYSVRSVTLEGVTLFDATELRGAMRTQIGAAYATGTDGDLGRDLRNLTERYQEIGHINALASDKSTIDLDSDQVDVLIAIAEGELVHVGEIEIRGNVETQDRIIRREIELFTGDPLNLQKLRRSEQKIRSLRYWSPQAGVTFETPEIPFEDFQIYRDAYVQLRDTKRENVQDIVVDVQETDTGALRFAIGVSTNAGFIGDVTWTKTNFDPLDTPESVGETLESFTGGGQIFILSFQPGTVVTRGRVLWGDQRAFDSQWSLTGELYLTEWLREDWQEGHEGLAFTVGREFGDDFRVDLTLRDEVADVSEIGVGAPQLAFDFEGRNEVASVQLASRLRRVDNLLDPTTGYELSATAKYAGLWGALSYATTTLRADRYFRLGENVDERAHVLQLSGTIGHALELGDTRDVPIFDRLFAGGSGTIRGFRFRGAGPHDGEDPIGGKAMWLASAEYLFPVAEESLRGVLFVDTGSVAESWSSADITSPRVSVGAGVRLVIPFLGDRPIAIDFGIPLLKQDGDETQLISFSFGSNF